METSASQTNDRQTVNSQKDPMARSQKLDRQNSGYIIATPNSQLPSSSSSSLKSTVSKPGLRSNRNNRATTSSRRRELTEKTWAPPSKYTLPKPHSHNYQQNHRSRSLFISSYNTPPSYYSDQQMHFSYYPLQLASSHFESLEHLDTTQMCTPRSPPPQTIHYWTSHSTRRLEYAAIDAASSGVRGFLVRLVPDCILPADARRTRLWRYGDGDSGEKEGSVRRYRLALPEDTEDKFDEERVPTSRKVGVECRTTKKRPGLLRKWSSGLGFSRR